jgi:anaphase-promoting complex subunit 2
MNSIDSSEIEMILPDINQMEILQEPFDSKLVISLGEIFIHMGNFKQYEELLCKFLCKNIEDTLKSFEDQSPVKPFLYRLIANCEKFHKNFLEMIFSPSVKQDQMFKQFYGEMLNNMMKFIYQVYGKSMIKRLFDIIKGDINIGVIQEIKEAIEKTDMLYYLADGMIKQIKSRLLISGVSTQSIINYFIDHIKIMQIIDPSGLIYDSVTSPIKNYLLQRPDALRGIINILTESADSYAKLGNESIKIPSRQQPENGNDYSSDEDEQQAEKWQILPVNSMTSMQNSKKSMKYKESDMVTWLVNLYGSQEAFINEYHMMLAEKLVCNRQYNIDEEVRNLELLKMKFGDNYLQNCNIIVKDIKDSKRINTNLHKTYDDYYAKLDKKKDDIFSILTPELLKFDKINTIFLSKGYWPINHDFQNGYEFPKQFRDILHEYGRKFADTKAMRKLNWHNTLGSVDLTLTFDNGDFPFKCLPAHAVLLSYFDENYLKGHKGDGLTLELLSSEVSWPPAFVKQLMTFWVHKGVINEVKGSGQTVNISNPFQRKSISFSGYFANQENNESMMIKYIPVKIFEQIGEDEIDWQFSEDVESELVKGQSQLTGDTTQFNVLIEGLVISMLNTNGPKTAEKIHSLLKTVYKTDIPYNYNETQTKEILRKMLAKQKISYNGEVYSTRVL